MRLSNGDVLLRWPLAQHIITAGWLYNDGSLHRALDFRAAVGTPVYAAEGGTVAIAYHWNGKRTQGDINSYGNMVKLRHADYRGGRLETLYTHLDSGLLTEDDIAEVETLAQAYYDALDAEDKANAEETTK